VKKPEERDERGVQHALKRQKTRSAKKKRRRGARGGGFRNKITPGTGTYRKHQKISKREVIKKKTKTAQRVKKGEGRSGKKKTKSGRGGGGCNLGGVIGTARHSGKNHDSVKGRPRPPHIAPRAWYWKKKGIPSERDAHWYAGKIK